MRRQLWCRVLPDCCKIDRLAGAEQVDAVASGSVIGSVILILGLTTAPSWRRADISFCALVVGRCDRFASRRPRPRKSRRPTRLQPLRLARQWTELSSHRLASRPVAGGARAPGRRRGWGNGGAQELAIFEAARLRSTAPCGAGDQDEFVAQQQLDHPPRSKEQLSGLPEQDYELTEQAQERRAGVVLGRV